MGISIGGSIAMVLACLDPTPDYIVPIIGHLQLADALEEAPIFWSVKKDLDRFGIDRARRKPIFDQFGLGELKRVLAAQRQLWIMARNDLYVVARTVERMQEFHASLGASLPCSTLVASPSRKTSRIR